MSRNPVDDNVKRGTDVATVVLLFSWIINSDHYNPFSTSHTPVP